MIILLRKLFPFFLTLCIAKRFKLYDPFVKMRTFLSDMIQSDSFCNIRGRLLISNYDNPESL